MTDPKILEELKDVSRLVFSEKFLDAAPEGQWITSKKDIIGIKTMTNGHLANAINMLQRKDLTGHKKYGELLREGERRGWVFNQKGGDFFLDGAL